MRARGFLAVLLALAATPAGAKGDRGVAFAEPADIIAADGAFLHLRTDKGAKAAMRATAQDDAQTYAPQLTQVADYVKSRSEPPLPTAWQPQQVLMSCDGSYAVSYGTWQNTPETGWYATVWHHQKNGSYKWVLDLGGKLAAALPVNDMITAGIADCPERRARKEPAAGAPARPAVPDYSAGQADDGTLAWSATAGPGGTLGFVAQLKQGGALHEVLRAGAAPPGP